MNTRPFTMNFNFKLVYTNFIHNIEIESTATLENLFDKASEKFNDLINYNKFYVDYVISGQEKSELAPAMGLHNLDQPLYYYFGNKWKEVSFYVRPIDRNTNLFRRFDRYNILEDSYGADIDNNENSNSSVDTPEADTSTINEADVVRLFYPPGLTRQNFL